MVKRRRKSKSGKLIGLIIAIFGLLFFMAGFYLLPVGTDFFLYFFVEIVMHGDWFWGDLLANAVALGMILIGFVLMRVEGMKPGLKKERGRKR